jgi:hypothetical protein
MRATNLEIRYVNHRNLDAVVNEMRTMVGDRKTIITSGTSFYPPKLPFACIAIHRQKTEYVVFLNKYFK